MVTPAMMTPSVITGSTPAQSSNVRGVGATPMATPSYQATPRQQQWSQPNATPSNRTPAPHRTPVGSRTPRGQQAPGGAAADWGKVAAMWMKQKERESKKHKSRSSHGRSPAMSAGDTTPLMDEF